MEITASMVKELRECTGAGPADCKKALVETQGDMEKATAYLRKKGLAAAAKKAGRIASEGVVHAYVHAGGRLGALVEVNCETDFVARSDAFQTFVREAAMQVVAMAPQYVSIEEVPAVLVEQEKALLHAKAKEQGKPEAVIGKIVDGQLNKWFKEICLREQPWVKDDKKTIRDLLQELIAKVGENCRIRRFCRFEMGEGLAKREDNFAAEVYQQAAL